MAKKITITLYSPKELWVKFWNRFFWPRRKKCAEWLDFGQCEVEYGIINDVLCKADELGITINDEELEKLELAIKPKITEAFDKLRIVITEPIY
jgi:hypothetical protein